MGKSARRSIKSDDPSSPSTTPSSYHLHNHHQTTQSTSSKLSSSAETSTTTIGKPQKQIKNVENKTSTIQQHSTSTSSATSSTKAAAANRIKPTDKPTTTTYKAFTTTYKHQTSSTRAYLNHTTIHRGDKMSELERLKLREEFFATYDVMTGIRIAATLGSFFVLMVFLIVYKSRSHTHKALQDPKIQARAAATVQEEEDREMQEAFEKTAFSLYADEFDMPAAELEMQRDRIRSLGNVSCPPYLINSNIRFSSIGGFSSLLDPSFRRLSGFGMQRRESNSDSSRILSAYHLNDNYCNQNENFFNESECDEDEIDPRFTTTAEISTPQGLLAVPRSADSRRSSGMTCCSTESSFLERRYSAITLGLSSYSRCSSRRASRDMFDNNNENLGACGGHHPDINIIEPTPKSSPCPSERQTHLVGGVMMKDHIRIMDRYKRKRQDDNSIDSITEYPDENSHQYRSDDASDDVNVAIVETSLIDSQAQNSKTLVSNDQQQHPNETRRAPLASLSSFKMSSIEFQSENVNEGVDAGSVFDDSCADDTDDDIDMEQFSTDSDELSLHSPPLTDKTEKFIASKKHHSHVNVISNADDKTLKTLTPASCCFSSNASDKKSKSNSSECVTIANVVACNNDVENVEKKNSPVKPSTPSSVILEMPVLAKRSETACSNNASENVEPDPSLPSTHRKWSKETLF